MATANGRRALWVLLPGPFAVVGEVCIFRQRCLTVYEISSRHCRLRPAIFVCAQSRQKAPPEFRSAPSTARNFVPLIPLHSPTFTPWNSVPFTSIPTSELRSSRSRSHSRGRPCSGRTFSQLSRNCHVASLAASLATR